MARYDENNNPYSWMPGFLRRFLNLTYDEPQGEAQGYSQSSYAPAAAASAARATWTPPSEPTFKATGMEGYTPPATTFTPPPAPQPRPATNGPLVVPNLAPPMQIQGSIQPVTYLLRAFARGVLPPQGLEAFTKELRATSTDVWNMYSHWTRFQTEDIFRFGRGVLTSVIESLPASSTPATTARRIKVTVAENGNGNGNGHGPQAAAADELKG